MLRPLKPSEYRLIVEHSPVMIWRSGVDAKCDYFNETWLAFTGRTLEQEMGDGWAEGVHLEDLERCVAHYLDHFRRREPFEMEYRLRRHDGVYRWIFDRGVPFTDESGQFAGFIGSCVDVDDRRKAQDAQKERALEQLALAQDFEKWILAVVSHDIRNPLGVIQLATLQLQNIAGSGAHVQKQIDTIARSTKRIHHIVTDLLDLSQERAGVGIPLEPTQVDLRAICLQIIDELEGLAPGRKIMFDCDVNGEGVWDEHRLLQAISNLISNALQHGSGPAVRVRLTGNEQQVIVEVQNEGAIPREIMPHLFEPFRSGRQYSKRGEGLGLGLFIAKAIARAHGGGLEIDCSSGNITFQLILPRSPSSSTDPRSGTLSNSEL